MCESPALYGLICFKTYLSGSTSPGVPLCRQHFEGHKAHNIVLGTEVQYSSFSDLTINLPVFNGELRQEQRVCDPALYGLICIKEIKSMGVTKIRPNQGSSRLSGHGFWCAWETVWMTGSSAP